jgi:putative aldouronate transport system permease protein
MKRFNKGYSVFNLVNITIMVFIGIIAVYPYLNVLVIAFNEGTDAMKGGITIFPRMPTIENFRLILSSNETLNAAFISVIRVISGTLLAVLVQFSAAYAFAKKGLLGRKAFLIFLTIPMFFGGGLIPQYLLYSKMHLLNNLLIYILPGAFSFYNMIIIRTYIYTIPASLEESAKLDGANEITILARIIFPLSLPIIATVCLWTAVGHWNDWVTTLYFITKARYYTLQYILMQMIQESDRIAKLLEEDLKRGMTHGTGSILHTATPESFRAAQVIITTMPIILVYPFLQKYFIKGIMIGSVKE